jgi:hypothetical protein
MSDGSHFKNAKYDWGLETVRSRLWLGKSAPSLFSPQTPHAQLVALVGPETTDKIIGADNVSVFLLVAVLIADHPLY